MFAKVYNYKFQGLSEAKIAATFCSDRLGKKIIDFNIRSLNISIGQCGSVAINLKFESGDDLNKFEDNSKHSFVQDARIRVKGLALFDIKNGFYAQSPPCRRSPSTWN